MGKEENRERMKLYRMKIKTDPGKYEAYKKKDAERKRESRKKKNGRMEDFEKQLFRIKERDRKRLYRQKKRK